MYFIITVDTEADYQKRGDDPATVQNLKALPRFQTLCEKYDMKPTYLITHEVASDEDTADFLSTLQREGRAEVGMHLHPWTTPPITKEDTKLRFPSQLSGIELREKFEVLFRKIKEKIGVEPTSYRAGRWGLDQRQENLLAEYGFLVDCSETPFVDWRHMGGPDFRRKDVLPHYKQSGILEVPMTILPTGMVAKTSHVLVKYTRRLKEGVYKKIINRLCTRVRWLRVFTETAESDLAAVYQSAKANNLEVIEFMIHSSELALGTSKFTQNQEQVEHMYDRIEFLFRFLQKQGVESIMLSTFAKEYRAV